MSGNYVATEDGVVVTDSPQGKRWGFTSDVWDKDSYLWRDGSRVMISLVFARNPGHGAFKAMVAAIEAEGLSVAVPCPLGHMRAILKKWGFRETFEYAPEAGGSVDVWVRQQTPKTAILWSHPNGGAV